MRRVRYYEYGGPEVLTVEESSLPEPDSGQVRLRAEAIGASFVDTKFRARLLRAGQPGGRSSPTRSPSATPSRWCRT